MEAISGRVREWYAESGWGVIDSDSTPGGCFAHYSTVDMVGFRQLSRGQHVDFTFESTIGLQDGFRFRTLEVRPHPSTEADAHTAGQQYPETGVDQGQRDSTRTQHGSAYTSSLSITFDEPERSEPD